MATVDLHRLTKIFGANTRAVDGLDLCIEHGELVALLGPSGCGKTTTLRLIAGFLEPDAGEVRVGGKLIASPTVMTPPERRNMSMIFQSYAVWPHKTVYQNVTYGLKFRHVTRAEAEQKVRQILGVVKLEHLADRYPSELSGGQQQRVALARALVVEPEILLLDEPLSNLDAHLREEMRFEIRRLHDEFQITSLYVTHDQAEAMVIADRICVMHQGQLEQVGTPEEIYEKPSTRFVAQFIGKTNLLPGRGEENHRIDLGKGFRLQIGEKENARPGENLWISIRPHQIHLRKGTSEAKMGVPTECNHFSGIISRRFYFGEAIDYLVQLLPVNSGNAQSLNSRSEAEDRPFTPSTLSPDTIVLRVLTPPSERYALGEKVSVLIHPEHCVMVKER